MTEVPWLPVSGVDGEAFESLKLRLGSAWRPSPSQALLDEAAAAWGLARGPAQDLGGSYSANLLIDGRVVRVHAPWVSADRVIEMQRLRTLVRSGSIPAAEPVPAAGGETLIEIEGSVVEVELFIHGERLRTFEQWLAAMRRLGELHSILEDTTITVSPVIANHLAEGDVADATRAIARVVRSWRPSHEEVRLLATVERLAARIISFGLGDQAVHGDFKESNVLFDGADLVAVLDFDFAEMRPRIDDVALPIHWELERGAMSIEQAAMLVDAYDSGLARPLSGRERQALPFAMARMPLAFVAHLTVIGELGRNEFRNKRGPACEWWLDFLDDPRSLQAAFEGSS